MNPLTRLILWLYIRPHEFTFWVYNRMMDLRDAFEKTAAWLNTSAGRVIYHASGTPQRPADRAWLVLFGDEESLPFSWTTDGALMRRATLAVAGTVGALAVLIISVPLLTPVALDVAQQGLQWARACVAGWAK